MIFAYRVTAGQERIVADLIYSRVKKGKLPIYSVASMVGLRGYLLVEAETETAARQAAMGIKHVKAVLARFMTMDDIKHMLHEEAASVKVKAGDLVELVSGPFKGEKAKVVRIDDAKEEVTVELTEVAVPIPVTVKLESLRVLQKVGEEKK